VVENSAATGCMLQRPSVSPVRFPSCFITNTVTRQLTGTILCAWINSGRRTGKPVDR